MKSSKDVGELSNPHFVRLVRRINWVASCGRCVLIMVFQYHGEELPVD